uniref:SH3 domain-containing protein n=1 Tax=Rhodnius prolixus TaxID=13249 RepID=T1HAB8_RHOPR
MLVVLLCLMMKILEFSSGKIIDTEQLAVSDCNNNYKKNKNHNNDGGNNKNHKKKKKIRSRISKVFFIFCFALCEGFGVGRGMTTVDELSLSPASDCNSNNVEASYASNTSDIEFIQDNCDYQWFLDYGYRDVQHQHRSVLSSCYDEMARDLDSQLAQVDMEDYTTQDILSTLPAMCCTDVQNFSYFLLAYILIVVYGLVVMQAERQGEMFASVSGSLMVKFEFDSSLSPHTSSQDESSMSLCQSEPLFSPVKEALPLLPPTNYSVDSLDADDQDHLIVTCQANKHNYTIAFHGSTLMGDTSEYTDTGDSMSSMDCNGAAAPKKSSKMAVSDAPTTTWSNLTKVLRRPRNRSKTISLPDLAAPPKLSCSALAIGRCMKLYDIQNSSSATSESFSGSGGETRSSTGQCAGAAAGNFSLLRMFIAQRSHATEQTNDNARFNVNNNNSFEREVNCDSSSQQSLQQAATHSSIDQQHQAATNVNRHNAKVGTSGTSELSEPTSSSENTTARVIITAVDRKCPIHCVDRSMQTSSLQFNLLNHTNTSVSKKLQNNAEPDGNTRNDNVKKPVYVLYPNYTLPDLEFLRRNSLDLDRVLLTPLKYAGSGGSTGSGSPQSPQIKGGLPYRQVTRADIEMLRQKGLSHVVDWTSLTPLLPSEYWSVLAELPQIRQHSAARFENTKPLFCMTPTQNKEFTTFNDPTMAAGKTGVNTSGCSTGTAPSSGYRGSSTLLSESGGAAGGNAGTNNPLYVYNYGSGDEKSRRISGRRSQNSNDTPPPQENKRYSMFEFGAVEEVLDELNENSKKRKSFPNQHVALKDTVDKEAWDDWWRDCRQRAHSPPSAHAQRLDQLIELSGHEQWRTQDIHNLRDQCKQAGMTEIHVHQEDPSKPRTDGTKKKSLVDGVIESVEKIISFNDENISQTVLDTLCPALYALFSDGLKHQLDTPFGPIGNSVWQVVEASAQQGPMTRALHDLVMKLNSEDVLSEGLIKFNAFVFGLLNVKGLDAYMSYIRTRETILSKHYVDDALLLSASRGQARCRSMTDSLITSLSTLSQCNFSLDLLYETRQLHNSLLQLQRLPLSPNQNVEMASNSLLLKKIVQSIRSGLSNFSSTEQSQSSDTKSCRPRSCVDAVAGGGAADLSVRKRWSGVQVGSRLANAFERLQGTEDDYPDSLETGIKSSSSGEELSGLDKEHHQHLDLEDKVGSKFRNLQRKWELLSGRDSIARDPSDTSPVKSKSKIGSAGSASAKGSINRQSRADLATEHNTQSKVCRPSSLPYRPPAKVQPRRAASSSTIRKPISSSHTNNNRHVVTLTHRLPSDSGHLAFNEGERLRLVLEVDDTWLLCCRGDQKGLVPRAAVI